MKKVSVIIPVYNVERYLEKSVNSVINQSYENIQIILVNDCSTDSSLQICRDYASKHPEKIKLIDKTRNEGVDKARFTALETVYRTNEEGYVMFLDSDDWIDKHSIKVMMQNAAHTHADIISMQRWRYYKGIKTKVKSYVDFKLFDKEELGNKWFISFFGYAGLSTYVTAKLYRVSILQKAALRPSSYRMCEDHIFNMYLFPHVSSWSNINYYGYNYRYGGMTCRFNPLWPELKNQNIEKRVFATSHNYILRVKSYLDIELKNIFYSDVAQRFDFMEATEFNKWLDMALSDDIWESTVDSAELEGNDDFKLIYSKDKSNIISLAISKTKESLTRRLAKKVLSLL